MTARKIVFSPLPVAATNVFVLGSLVLDKRDILGPKAIIDFSDLKDHQGLARDLVASLDEHAAPEQIESDLSLLSYGQVIRVLLRYCSLEGVPSDFRMRDIDLEFVLDFRVYLQVAFSELKSDVRRRLFGNFERLLRAGQSLGLLSVELVIPKNFKHAFDSDVTQPYTAGEALDIESACREHIRALIARLDKGQELLRQGIDPRGRPSSDPNTGRFMKMEPEDKAWNQLPNLLWYVVNVMDGQFIKYSGRGGTGHSSFNNATNGAYKGPYRKTDVFCHLYPLAEDLIPFIILFAKSVGLNESSILGLRRDCLQEIDGQYVLWFRKARGSAGLYRKIIPTEGQFSPVALLKVLHEITAPLVRYAKPEFQELLFLGFTVKGQGREPVKPIDPVYIKAQMNRAGGWCTKNNLMDAHGRQIRISLRRFRVYYLSLRYKKHGQLSKVSRDAAHTLAQTTVSYVANASTKHIHERSVEAGIRAAREVAKPTVVVSDSPDEASQAIGASKTKTERVLRGEQDVFFAACRDFYNRPGGEENVPCDKPWNCLTCPNAIVTRHLLPRVLAFRDFMAEQRKELEPDDWALKFSEAWQVVHEDILPKFSAETIEEAERYAASERLYIPLSIRQ